MGKVIAGITMSLDGFISDRNGSLSKLYPDFAEMHDVPSFQEMIDSTGAVVMGKRAFQMGDPDSYAVDYEFQVPIFVLAHSLPQRHPQENENLKFTFVTNGIKSAIARARTAAGDRDVQVIGGASAIQQCLNEGLCDELHIDIVPVLLGGGLRLFEHLDPDSLKLETIDVAQTTPARTSLRFRVVG
jgi:dihydrofolate reductase